MDPCTTFHLPTAYCWQSFILFAKNVLGEGAHQSPFSFLGLFYPNPGGGHRRLNAYLCVSHTIRVESKCAWAEGSCLGWGCGLLHGMQACLLFHWDVLFLLHRNTIMCRVGGRGQVLISENFCFLLVSSFLSLFHLLADFFFFQNSLSLSLFYSSTLLTITTNNQHPLFPTHFSLPTMSSIWWSDYVYQPFTDGQLNTSLDSSLRVLYMHCIYFRSSILWTKIIFLKYPDSW